MSQNLDLLPPALQNDVARISQISIVPTILETICRTTHMGFAAVARVTDTRWVACSVRDEIGFGLKPGDELKLETTICDEIRQSGNGVVIDHVTEDKNFCHHHTPEMYGFQSYISLPILRKDGSFFGTLCAIDPKPAHLNNPEVINTFRLFAELIALHIESLEERDQSVQMLKEEKQIAELREQFIAILGHDLRNPIGAIANSAQLLMRMNNDEKTFRLASIISDSSYRVKGLIENILDFARGRLGEGIQLTREHKLDPHVFVDQIIAEMQILYPDAEIQKRLNISNPVHIDERRIAQLFSNLLGNALAYGKPDHPIIVEVIAEEDHFQLSVSNASDKIPDSSLEHLFQPFSRGKAEQGQNGLGLGLYISSEIAKAHGGDLSVKSDKEQTTFTFKMLS